MIESAFFWGIISAVSLPLGAALGLMWRPGSKIISAFMAFGAGALLFALTIELMAHVPVYAQSYGIQALIIAITGAIAGGLIFNTLNRALNSRGAFLRNLSNAKDHVARTKKARARRLARSLSRMKTLQNIPPEDLAELVKYVRREKYNDGQTIFDVGDDSRELHFLRSGQVQMMEEDPHTGECRVVQTFGPHDAFGERALFAGNPRSTTARAKGETVLYTLDKADLRSLVEEHPRLSRLVDNLTSSQQLGTSDHKAQERFIQEVEEWLDDLNVPVNEREIADESAGAVQVAGVAMAIWLGIAIDAVPESLVIGTLAVSKEGMSLAFIAGVFLANLPESLSSAVSMRNHGFTINRIMWMWSSLCLLTGIGAMFGAWIFPPNSENAYFYLKLLVEGLAAGAMLTAIAETMLPEAFEQGGSIVGLATLMGFLAALTVATLG